MKYVGKFFHQAEQPDIEDVAVVLSLILIVLAIVWGAGNGWLP